MYPTTTVGCQQSCPQQQYRSSDYSYYYTSNAFCASGLLCDQTEYNGNFTCGGTTDTNSRPYGCGCYGSTNYACKTAVCSNTGVSGSVLGTCGAGSGISAGAWGFPCTYNYECGSGSCAGYQCLGKASGQSCSYTNECARGLTCVSAGYCTPALRLGATCGTLSSSVPCVPYGVCDSTLGKCVPLFSARTGSRCTTTSQCAVRLCSQAHRSPPAPL
jgi:hypothetical protein